MKKSSLLMLILLALSVSAIGFTHALGNQDLNNVSLEARQGPPIVQCWHVQCLNGNEIWYCGSESGLANKIRVVCSK